MRTFTVNDNEHVLLWLLLNHYVEHRTGQLAQMQRTCASEDTDAMARAVEAGRALLDKLGVPEIQHGD